MAQRIRQRQTNKQTQQPNKQTTIRPTKFYIGRTGNGSAHPSKRHSDVTASEDVFDLVWSPIHGFATNKQTTIRPSKFYIGRAGTGWAHPAKNFYGHLYVDAFDFPLFRRLLASKGKNKLSCDRFNVCLGSLAFQFNQVLPFDVVSPIHGTVLGLQLTLWLEGDDTSANVYDCWWAFLMTWYFNSP